MKKNLLTLALISAFTVGCASKNRVSVGGTPVKAGNIMEARVNWLKDKKDKFDFNLSLQNTSDKGVIIYLNDISCMKGTSTGEVKHTFFNTGERTIDFRPGQMKEFKLVCILGHEVPDNSFKVIVKRINEDQFGNGTTAGKILARNLTIPVTL
jgi:hypothetical protein